jgi:hypothetical protein
MDILGYHVVSEPTGDGHVYDPPLKPGQAPTSDHVMVHDGFATTVTSLDGKSMRGPFPTIKQAIDAAKAWKKEDEDAAKKKLQAVEDAAPTVANTMMVDPTKPVECPQVSPAVVNPTVVTLEKPLDAVAIDADGTVTPIAGIATDAPPTELKS